MAIRVPYVNDSGLFPADLESRLRADSATYVKEEIESPGSPLATALSAAFAGGELARPSVISTPAARSVVGTDAGHSWGFSSGGSVSTLADTLVFARGEQSIKLVTDGTGAPVIVEHSGLSLDARDGYLKIWVRSSDVSKISALYFYAFTDGLSTGSNNYWLWHVERPPEDAATAIIKNGEWRSYTLPWAMASKTGTPSKVITDLRFRSEAAAGHVANFGGADVIGADGTFPNGVVTLTFDDANITQYTTAAPIMDRYGFPGTAYLIPGALGGGPNSMTLNHVKELQATRGWEISGHNAFSLEDHSNYPDIDLERAYRQVRTFLKANGLNGSDNGAHPYGRQNVAIRDVASKYVAYGRGSSTSAAIKYETLPPMDPALIRPFGVTSTTTVADVKSRIDRVRDNGDWLVLIFHRVSNDVDSLAYGIDKFTEIVDYLASSGVAVRTVGDALKGVGSTTKTVTGYGTIPLAPTYSTVGSTLEDGLGGYSLPDALTHEVHFLGVSIPQEAKVGARIKCEFQWVGPGAGGVYWRVDFMQIAPSGELATKAANPHGFAAASPATAKQVLTSTGENVLVVADGTAKTIHVRIARIGSHADDTNTGTVRLIGARLIYEQA